MNTETERVTENVDDTTGTKPHKVGGTTLTTPSPRVIRAQRMFAANAERVWRAFTERDQLAQWWGRGHTLDVEKLDLRPGGEWRFVEHAPDGTTGFYGTVREVTPQARIVQTFAWDGMTGHASTETAVFENLGDKTLLTSTMEFDSEEERDEMMRAGMAEGMEQSYAALDALLARG